MIDVKAGKFVAKVSDWSSDVSRTALREYTLTDAPLTIAAQGTSDNNALHQLLQPPSISLGTVDGSLGILNPREHYPRQLEMITDDPRPQVSRTAASGLLAITLSSRKRLELNITSTFIELALTTVAIMGREGDKTLTRARGINAPFLIRNRTGYPLSLWSESTDKPDKASTERLADGADVPWRFDDWKKMREVSAR
jgi:hypothetical protein